MAEKVLKVLKVFTQEGCAPCVRAKMALDARDVPYESCDIREEPELIEEYGLSSTPTLIVIEDGKEIFRGGAHQVAEVTKLLSK